MGATLLCEALLLRLVLVTPSAAFSSVFFVAFAAVALILTPLLAAVLLAWAVVARLDPPQQIAEPLQVPSLIIKGLEFLLRRQLNLRYAVDQIQIGRASWRERGEM